MKYNGTEYPFPAIGKVSFEKILLSLEEQAKDEDPLVAQHAQELLKDMEPYPELREGIVDYDSLDKYQQQITRLCRTIFPDALVNNEIKAVTAPFNFSPLHMSKRLKTIMKNAGEDFTLQMKDFDPDRMYVMGCLSIMASYYGYPLKLSKPMNFEIPDQRTGLSRYYRLAFNADMMECVPTEKAPKITEEDYLQLINDFENVDLWKEKFPPDSYILKGIGVINMMDLTIDQAMNMITANLLVRSPDAFDKIRENLRVVFDIPDLLTGFVAIENGLFTLEGKDGMTSLLMHENMEAPVGECLCTDTYEQLIVHREPVAISDVVQFHEQYPSPLTENLYKQGIGSYLAIPLIHEGDFLGLVEIGSPRKLELNSAALKKLNEVLPILAMAAKRFKDEAMNKMEAIIQQECTTIHPSVKWRFENEAQQYLHKLEAGEQPTFKDIALKDIYPLYGQLDIKSSSTTRNEAVKKDLIKQMDGVLDLLQRAHKIKRLPALEELQFRVKGFLSEISDGLLAGSEHKILGFLRAEIYPVVNHLKSYHPAIEKLVDDYSATLDPELHMVYDARKDFDQSVTLINERLAAFIDQKQQEAQQMFPHYFERYKTDGLEYNMYIGQSIVQNDTFHDLYLGNLRLWQLMVMCQMEHEFYRMGPELKSPLEIASLILVYNNSLSIQFRMDEKRFDVEGAYNARYEIVKKRVDKAHIKGTTERVTVPGKIAIIYTGEEVVLEYQKYISFLMSKGLIKKGSLERLELEDLQGITGLKALRVEIDYSQAKRKKKKELTYDEVIEGLETMEN